MTCLPLPSAFLTQDGPQALPEAVAHHVHTVLRLRIGDEVKLLDGAGAARLARLVDVGRKAVLVEPIGALMREAPPRPALTLFQCVAKPARMDWLLEKVAELGVARLVPILSSRTVAHVKKGETPDRWLRIVEAGLCQSNGLWATHIDPVTDWDGALAQMAAFDGPIAFGDLSPAAQPLAHAAKGGHSLACLIGPEGDFSDAERAAVLALPNVTPVSLGPRILRVETAALYTLSVLQALFSSSTLRKAAESSCFDERSGL